MKKRRGFTIIELLIVCMIITILTLVVVLNLERSEKTSRDAERKSNLTKIATALEIYKVDKKVYPKNKVVATDTFQKIEDVFISTYDLGDDTTANYDLVSGNYLSTLPQGPLSSDVYNYLSDGSQYKITAKSEIIESISDAQGKAGDFYDSATDCYSCLQVSSSNTALSWADTRCQPLAPVPTP